MFGFSTEQLDRVARLQKCHRVSGILSSYFDGEKKKVLPLTQVVEKLKMSTENSMSSGILS